MTKISKPQADVVRMPNETEIETFKSPETQKGIDRYVTVDSGRPEKSPSAQNREVRGAEEGQPSSAALTGLMVYCFAEAPLTDWARESAMRCSLAR